MRGGIGRLAIGARPPRWFGDGALAWKRSWVALALFAGGAALACVPSANAAPAPTPPGPVTVRVASKTFTESVVLGEIITQLLRGNGVAASHRSGFGGTRLLWDALLGGAIDIYPEYTGTLIEEILAGHDGAANRTGSTPDTQQIHKPGQTIETWVREALATRGIGIVGPLGFNNTYAVGVTSATAQRLGLSTISDLRAHPALRFGFSSEFISRQDGWPALRRRYALPQTDVKGLDHDLAYRGIAAGALDATDLYATDAEIKQYGLRVLTDDLHLFPRYDAVLLYRLDGVPRAMVAALAPLVGRIDEATMASLNARAKLERIPESEVASTFLRSKLGVKVSGAPAERRGSLHSILDHAIEHLLLVGVSLLAAILLAVPLGVVAARWPRMGQIALAATGLIQTIPSLALLVFMIPLFGIGTVPATVALFLYSLLPIVRNTHAGLRNIPPSIKEAADGLGLSPWAILWTVDLPLASPLILAGIKSAAVINVGTATLGALIGAGGFGQPIFTGIRLDDLGLILQGAVPASILALLVQGLFELLERLLVPRGLRLGPRA